MKSLFHATRDYRCSGPPMWERRLLLDLPVRAEAIQKPGLVAAVYGLIGANRVDAEQVRGWLSDWKAAYRVACETPGVDARFTLPA